MMDEVTTMSRAGESVGKAVGTGIRTARHGADRARKVSKDVFEQAAALAEQELISHGVSTENLYERLSQAGMSRKELAKAGKKARKKWEKKSAKSRKQLSEGTKVARKELAAKIAPAEKKSRKWPWVLLFLVVGTAVAAAVVLSRRPEELPIADAEHNGSPHPDGRTSYPGNGHGPAHAQRPAEVPTTPGEHEH